jgi:3-oxoacyl-[acyl-carrier protein] reductase
VKDVDLRLRDARVLVTGGSGSIGRTTALAFAAEGARVAITYRGREDAAKAVADEITDAGGQAHVVPLDLNDAESIEAAVASTVEAWGGLDVLVANAVNWGIDNVDDFENLPDRIEDTDGWQRVIEGNLHGNVALVRAAAPALRRSATGRVVLLSSDVADRGMLGGWAYGAAKAGLHGLAVNLAPDLGRDGVLVNVVLPGITTDDGHHHVIPDQALPAIADRYPAKRLATVHDVAATIAFLGSPRNGAITGEIVRVTGGSPAVA